MFKFELDPVLRHREHIEQEAQRRLAAESEALLRAETALAECRAGQDDLAEDHRREAASGLALARHTLYSAWRGELRRQETSILVTISQARQRVKRAREALALAHRERRKLELLRERAWQQHLAESERRERIFADDMMVMRHGRGGEV